MISDERSDGSSDGSFDGSFGASLMEGFMKMDISIYYVLLFPIIRFCQFAIIRTYLDAPVKMQIYNRTADVNYGYNMHSKT